MSTIPNLISDSGQNNFSNVHEETHCSSENDIALQALKRKHDEERDDFVPLRRRSVESLTQTETQKDICHKLALEFACCEDDLQLLSSCKESKDLKEKIPKLSQAILQNETFVKKLLEKLPNQSGIIIKAIGKSSDVIFKNYSSIFLTDLIDNLPENEILQVLKFLSGSNIEKDPIFMEKVLNKLPGTCEISILCIFGALSHSHLKDDKELIKKVVAKISEDQAYLMLGFLSNSSLKNNQEVMEDVLDKLPRTDVRTLLNFLKQFPSPPKENKDFILKAFNKLPEEHRDEILDFLNLSSLKNNKEVMETVLGKFQRSEITKVLNFLKFCSSPLKDDEDFMKKLLAQLPKSHVHKILGLLGHSSLRCNLDFLKEVLKKSPESHVHEIINTFSFDLSTQLIKDYNKEAQILSAVADVLEINEEDLWKRIQEKNLENIVWIGFSRTYHLDEFNPNIEYLNFSSILREEFIKALKEIKTQLNYLSN